MQSTLSLTLDLTTKKGRFTDITDYAAINVNVAGLGAMGSVQVYFQGTLVDTLPINLGGAPSLRVSQWFDLELDVNGEVANGSYSAVYTVSFDFSCSISTTAPTEIIMVSGPTFGTNYQGFSPGASITISDILPGGSIIDTSENQSGDLVINITGTIATGSSSAEQVSVTNLPNNFSWVYAGCNMVESKASLVADCDYGDFGTFTVSNETNLEGVTLQSLTVDINYPSWTNQATITQTVLPFTQNNLATGTYSVELTQQIEKVQNDGLIINYEATCIQEFKVTCSGSLCGLNECIENLRKAHEAELLKNKVSKYQVYVDNILVYYMEAENYKACGEMDKYRAEVAKIETQLDASGCDCGCCDENVYKWVQNTSANAINIIASIEQLQDDAVLTADNGLTKTANNVALGGALIGDTSVDLLSYQLKFDASTGSSTFTRDYDATNPYGLTTPLNVRGEYSQAYPQSNGPAIAFQTSNAGLAANMGFLGFVWENLTSGGNTQFRLFTRKDGAFDWRFLVQSDGKIKGKEYGLGNFLDNNPEYFLGVDNSGAFIQIDPDNVGATASNGLTKTNGDIKLGGTLNQNTSIIANEQSGYKFTISDVSFGSWPIPFYINDGGSSNSGVFMVYTRNGFGVANTGVYYNNIPGNDYSYNIYVTPCEDGGISPEEETPQFKVYGDSVAQKGKIQMTRYGKGNHINNSPQYFLGVDNNGNCVEINPANVGSNTIASNGLTKTGNEIKLGGTLTSDTTITTSDVNTLALAGLQTSIASNILALNNANEIIKVDNTIPYRVYCACVSQTSPGVPTVDYTVINTLGLNPNYGNGNTGEYTFQIPNTDLTKAFISITTGDAPQKPNGVFITFKISTQNPDTMRIYTYSPGVGKEAELLKQTLIKIEFYA